VKRGEAEALVGKRVSAWTSANGSYVGELVGIAPGSRPWRGLIRIDGVLDCAVHYECGRTVFRGGGKRVGQVIEAGESSISPTEAAGLPDYASAVDAKAEYFERTYAEYGEGRFGDPGERRAAGTYGWMGSAAEAYRKVAVAVRGLAPLDDLLLSEAGTEAVAAAVRAAAGDGLLPGRERVLGAANAEWAASIGRAVARDEFLRDGTSPFLEALLSRLPGGPRP
jgi:hypothetical protein